MPALIRRVIVTACCMALLYAASPSNAAERVRLVFVGDIMAHAEQLDAAERGGKYDFSAQFYRIAPLFHRGLVIGNLETVFAGKKSGYAGYPSFNTPGELADALLAVGTDVVTLANNHILDRREAGAARTIDVLESKGLLWTGLARDPSELYAPLVVDRGGIEIALLNFTYGSNTPPSQNASGGVFLNVISKEAVIAGLSKARELEPDLTVVCFHWGNEYEYAPTRWNRTIAEVCFENGADMVIGTHPHVLQPVEIAGGENSPKLTAWSLGNFVSNQRTLPRERSVVLAVDVEKTAEAGTAIKRVSVAPTWVSSRRISGRRRIEVVYAGTGGPFNHSGMPAGELNRARAAGQSVLEFLGARKEPDEEGFYTLWDSASPDVLPVSGRSSPR